MKQTYTNPNNNYKIEIDLSRDKLMSEAGLKRFEDSYFMSGEISPQERFAFVSTTFASNQDHAQRLYDYASQQYLSYSTPVLAYGRSNSGLPISCFLNYIEDTKEGLIKNLIETANLTIAGGGVGSHFKIRTVDEKSTGVIRHIKTYDALSVAYKQATTRRGALASFLDIHHPEIVEFIDIRRSTGDMNSRCPNMHHGINITDAFMSIINKCMIDPTTDDSWDLIDDKTGKIVETVSAKELWKKILTARMETGEPYMIFIDTANDSFPQFLKDQGLQINGSNICTEIFLATAPDRTAVCCLASINLEHRDEIKKLHGFIKDVMEMLDNVLECFITTAPSELSRAVFSAKKERSVGLGTLGFHAYLQKNNIGIETPMAKGLNLKIFKEIHDAVHSANLELGKERGEPDDCKGTGRRFSLTMAIAPNASTSFIMNTSPSIEPWTSNTFSAKTLSGNFTIKNKYLDKLLRQKCKDDLTLNYDLLWKEILDNQGSVKTLTCLTDYEKLVFKTAEEIDQRVLVELAADRQIYIDQGQSLNLFFSPDADVSYVHATHFLAWKKKLKSVYYCRTDSVGNRDMNTLKQKERIHITNEYLRSMTSADGGDCLSCQ